MREILNIDSKEKFLIETSKSGENHLACPNCQDDHPKSRNKKCFSWNEEKRTGKCFRCEATFVEFIPRVEQKENYVLPKWNDKTELSEEHLKWFHRRMISNEALIKAGVYSGKEWMPQFEKEMQVVCFPFVRNGQAINVKYRGANKSFKLVKGAEKIFFNMDLAKGTPSVVIVEGEIDALSFLTCGINFVVSVPNGASTNLDYLDNCIDFFEEKEDVILAVDQDPKGLELQKELARRIGPEKCRVVDFLDCKDANEFLVKYGAPELFRTVEVAKDYPMGGVYTTKDLDSDFTNLYYSGLKPGVKLGVKSLDESITWETGRLVVVSGIPGHGKSEVVDFIISKLNMLHGWKPALFSPENHPMQIHLAKLCEKFIGKPFGSGSMSTEEFNQAKKYLNKNFYLISPDEDFSIESVLSKARFLVKKYGIKILVIDPYNRMDHHYSGDTETKYISNFLDKLTTFSQKYSVLVFLVAHPYKMQKEGGQLAVPNLYSIAGSSNFYNKADYGFTVYRKVKGGLMANEIEIHIQKVKFKHLGKPNLVELAYNERNGRFEEGSVEGIDGWDNSNWLSELPF